MMVEPGRRYFWCACGRGGERPFCAGSRVATRLGALANTAKKTGDVWSHGCKAAADKPRCDGTRDSL
jgi:CDGSH-type Zn-finger protein